MFRLRHKLTPRTTTKGTGMHYRVGCWQETLVGKMRGNFYSTAKGGGVLASKTMREIIREKRDTSNGSFAAAFWQPDRL